MSRTAWVLAALWLQAGAGAYAGDLARGEELVEWNCRNCHDSELYTRPDRIVKSYQGLRSQVRRCEQMLGLTWFDDDLEAVVDYLNHHYYKFEPTP